jgi:hypothetical protein
LKILWELHSQVTLSPFFPKPDSRLLAIETRLRAGGKACGFGTLSGTDLLPHHVPYTCHSETDLDEVLQTTSIFTNVSRSHCLARAPRALIVLTLHPLTHCMPTTHCKCWCFSHRLHSRRGIVAKSKDLEKCFGTSSLEPVCLIVSARTEFKSIRGDVYRVVPRVIHRPFQQTRFWRRASCKSVTKSASRRAIPCSKTFATLLRKSASTAKPTDRFRRP